MLKKTVTYTNFEGEEVTEDFYFNLSKGEVIEMQLSEKEGLDAKLLKIVQADDRKAIIEAFRDILRASVGQRSPDGKRFLKSEEIASGFMDSGAYDEVLVELFSNANAATEFVQAVIPKDIAKGVAKSADPVRPNVDPISTEPDNRPAWMIENREPTPEEIRSMSGPELAQAWRMKAESLGSTSDGTAAKLV